MNWALLLLQLLVLYYYKELQKQSKLHLLNIFFARACRNIFI